MPYVSPVPVPIVPNGGGGDVGPVAWASPSDATFRQKADALRTSLDAGTLDSATAEAALAELRALNAAAEGELQAHNDALARNGQPPTMGLESSSRSRALLELSMSVSLVRMRDGLDAPAPAHDVLLGGVPTHTATEIPAAAPDLQAQLDAEVRRVMRSITEA